MSKANLALGLLLVLVAGFIILNKFNRVSLVPPIEPSWTDKTNSGKATALVARWVSRPASRRSAPRAETNPAPIPEEEVDTRLSDLLEKADGLPRPSAEVLDRYIEKNGGAAESLLTAYRQSKDTNWLFRAAQEYGNDPRVQLEMISLDLGPEQRAAWLEAFKQTAPDNSLANYLAAAHHLQQGDVDQALVELETANQKKEFSAFLADSMQNTEELYLEAGASELQAKAKAFLDTEFNYLGTLKDFSNQLQEQQAVLRQEGRAEEADFLAVLGMQFAQHLSLGDGNRTILNQLLGLRIEQSFLDTLDPQRVYPDLPMPVAEMRQAITDQRDLLKELTGLFVETLPQAHESVLSRYFDRLKIFGEYEALQWLSRQQTGQSGSGIAQ